MLVDVELWGHVRRIGFARRGFERSQVRAVDLVTLHQADVFQVRRTVLDHGDHVDEHRQIGRHQLGPRGAFLVRGVEDVRDVCQVRESASSLVAVEQVHRNVLDALSIPPRRDRPMMFQFPVRCRCSTRFPPITPLAPTTTAVFISFSVSEYRDITMSGQVDHRSRYCDIGVRFEGG